MARNTGRGSRYGAGLRNDELQAMGGNPQSIWATQIGTTGRFTEIKAQGGNFAANRGGKSWRRWFRR